MTIVIKGGKLVDGTGRQPVENSAVVVQDGRLKAVGSQEDMSWPIDAVVIDATGKTVLPGLIDCHAHMIAYEYDLETRVTTPMSLTVVKTLKNMKTTLDLGITTLRDGGGVDLGLKLAVEQGLVPGPRLHICIVPITQTGGLFDLHIGSGAQLNLNTMYGTTRHFVNGVENLRQLSRDLLLAGADFLKVSSTGSVYKGTPGIPPGPQYTVEEMKTVVYEAHAAGKKTMTHCEGGIGLRNALEAGIDTIEHGFYLTDEDIQMMLDKDVFLVPTLNCNYGILKVIERDPDAGIHAKSVDVARRIIDDHAKSIQKAIQAGVKIAMGTDAFGWDQGDNLYELMLLVGLGMTPMEAIITGTLRGAELLGVEDELGSLEVGKIADVVVIDGDPLADISIMRSKENVALIMQNGNLYKNNLGEKLPG
ncbi:MAG: amidohydrolase family protein [Anaerolineales bacterium]|nr:amidohydrolase family protein [Anaerolineales bacterium]